MFNISGCVPIWPNDIVYLVLANKINTSAYLLHLGSTIKHVAFLLSMMTTSVD